VCYFFYESSSIWPSFDRYREYDITLCRLMSKHQNIVYKTNLKFEISMRKKYQKMEVSKFLYFVLVNFNLMLFTVWSSILFHDQFTDSLLHYLKPVLVNYEILLDWMMSEAFQCYRRKQENSENRWRYWLITDLVVPTSVKCNTHLSRMIWILEL